MAIDVYTKDQIQKVVVSSKIVVGRNVDTICQTIPMQQCNQTQQSTKCPQWISLENITSKFTFYLFFLTLVSTKKMKIHGSLIRLMDSTGTQYKCRVLGGSKLSQYKQTRLILGRYSQMIERKYDTLNGYLNLKKTVHVHQMRLKVALAWPETDYEKWRQETQTIASPRRTPGDNNKKKNWTESPNQLRCFQTM